MADAQTSSDDAAQRQVGHDQKETGAHEEAQRPQLPFFACKFHGVPLEFGAYGVDFTNQRELTVIYYRQLDKLNNPIMEKNAAGEMVEVAAFPVAAFLTVPCGDMSNLLGRDAYVLGTTMDAVLRYLNALVVLSEGHCTPVQADALSAHVASLTESQSSDGGSSSNSPTEALVVGTRLTINDKHVDLLDLNASFFFNVIPRHIFPLGTGKDSMYPDVIVQQSLPAGQADEAGQEWKITDATLGGRKHKDNDAELRITFNGWVRMIRQLQEQKALQDRIDAAKREKVELLKEIQDALANVKKNAMGPAGKLARVRAMRAAARAAKRCMATGADGSQYEESPEFCRLSEDLMKAVGVSAGVQLDANIEKMKHMKGTDDGWDDLAGDTMSLSHDRALLGAEKDGETERVFAAVGKGKKDQRSAILKKVRAMKVKDPDFSKQVGELLRADRTVQLLGADEGSGVLQELGDKIGADAAETMKDLQKLRKTSGSAFMDCFEVVLSESHDAGWLSAGSAGGDAGAGMGDLANVIAAHMNYLLKASTPWDPWDVYRTLPYYKVLVGSDDVMSMDSYVGLKKRNDDYMKSLKKDGRDKQNDVEWKYATLLDCHFRGKKPPGWAVPKPMNAPKKPGDKSKRVGPPKAASGGSGGGDSDVTKTRARTK